MLLLICTLNSAWPNHFNFDREIAIASNTEQNKCASFHSNKLTDILFYDQRLKTTVNILFRSGYIYIENGAVVAVEKMLTD